MTANTRVFVLSTGRSGSTFVAQVLSADGSDNPISHQQPGSRVLNILGNLVQARRIPLDRGFDLATRFGFDDSSTADPLRSMIIAAGLRTRRFERARVVHVVRDPRAFVTSFMNWKDASTRRRILHHVVPAWQPNPWLIGEASFMEWARMSKFEHFCWVWNYKNRLFESLSDACEYRRFRLEDLNLGRENALLRLGHFLGVNIPMAATRDAQLNASQGRFPAWRGWSGRQAAVLQRHCGELMEEYGYAGDSDWSAKCHSLPADATYPVSI